MRLGPFLHTRRVRSPWGRFLQRSDLSARVASRGLRHLGQPGPGSRGRAGDAAAAVKGGSEGDAQGHRRREDATQKVMRFVLSGSSELCSQGMVICWLPQPENSNHSGVDT